MKTCAAIELAKRFHTLYEGMAPAYGYKTRSAIRQANSSGYSVPQRSKTSAGRSS